MTRPPARPTSLRLRLLCGAVAWIVLSVLLAGLSLAHLFRQHAQAQFRSELALHLNQLTAVFALDADNQAGLRADMSDPRLAQPFSGLYWQIDALDAQGHTTQAAVLRSRSLWDQVLSPPAASSAPAAGDGFYASAVAGQTVLVLARTLLVEDETAAGAANATHWRLSIAADEENLHAPIERFDAMLLTALGLLTLGMSVAAWALVFGGLRPLKLLRQRLTEVASGRSSQMDGTFPREIQPLVDEFNAVLARNATMLERARTQAGNLAHAVKTPLSILENAAHDAHESHDPEALRRLVIEQVRCAQRHIDWHLARARAAAAAGPGPAARTQLDAVLPALVRTIARLYARRALDIGLDMEPGLAVRCEAQDVQEMLGNLLDNAGKWARSTVRVNARTAPENPAHVSLCVDDDGAGLSPDEAARAFKRGVRLDERTPGTGLGLSIVADMVDLYQGHICAETSPLGGLRMRLTLAKA